MDSLNLRIIHTHDTEENWNKLTNFIPKQGEVIVYDVDKNYSYQRFKIGDGVKALSELKFTIDETVNSIFNVIDNKIILDGGRITEYIKEENSNE